ncbi:DoxX family protein [Joostella sp. CR20]|uniref:DoxX family protein n=1 Tax=Joostella sp. CR20 TaxID=2804312 RepID=UPI00313AC925
MQQYLQILPAVCLLVFIAITFLFSFIDKVTDWNGNLSFLQTHFKDTFVVPLLPFTLFLITILELIAGVLAIIGIVYLFASNNAFIAIVSCIISLIVLFIFLIGQRIAKDFDGAMKITIYIIAVVLCLYFLI